MPVALLGECSIPVVEKVRAPAALVIPGELSQPWRAMPTVTCPMPDQESSRERSAYSARSRGHRAPGEAERRHEEPPARIGHAANIREVSHNVTEMWGSASVKTCRRNTAVSG